jgi:hypothetical protein
MHAKSAYNRKYYCHKCYNRNKKEKGSTAQISLGVVPEYRATGIKITISF